MLEAQPTPTETGKRVQLFAQSVFVRANPRLILPCDDGEDAVLATCSPSMRLRELPPRRGGSQLPFAPSYVHTFPTNVVMHPVHKLHNKSVHNARLTRSLAAVCELAAGAKKNAPHTHNQPGPPRLASRQRNTNPLLSPLTAWVTNSPFRDCSLIAVELSPMPVSYL